MDKFMPLYDFTKSVHEDILREKHKAFTLYDTTRGTNSAERIGGFDSFEECEKTAQQLKARYPERTYKAFDEMGAPVMAWVAKSALTNFFD